MSCHMPCGVLINIQAVMFSMADFDIARNMMQIFYYSGL